MQDRPAASSASSVVSRRWEASSGGAGEWTSGRRRHEFRTAVENTRPGGCGCPAEHEEIAERGKMQGLECVAVWRSSAIGRSEGPQGRWKLLEPCGLGRQGRAIPPGLARHVVTRVGPDRLLILLGEPRVGPVECVDMAKIDPSGGVHRPRPAMLVITVQRGEEVAIGSDQAPGEQTAVGQVNIAGQDLARRHSLLVAPDEAGNAAAAPHHIAPGVIFPRPFVVDRRDGDGVPRCLFDPGEQGVPLQERERTRAADPAETMQQRVGRPQAGGHGNGADVQGAKQRLVAGRNSEVCRQGQHDPVKMRVQGRVLPPEQAPVAQRQEGGRQAAEFRRQFLVHRRGGGDEDRAARSR